MSKALETISCTFNIFDNGRVASGIDRGYILDNIKKAVNSDFTQERIKLREAVGYVGHGLRSLAGKLDLGEVESVNLGGGQKAVVKAIPACVTTDLTIDDEGNISHTQEVLDNEEGKTLLGLHKSRVGGFSWASNGAKGIGRTLVDKIFGFDYVTNPNFIQNRGYVLDSADGDGVSEAMILDNMTSCGLEPEAAQERLQSWWSSTALELSDYQDEISSIEAELIQQRKLNRELQDQVQAIHDSADRRDDMLREFAVKSSLAFDAEKLISLARAEKPEDMNGFKAVLDSASGMDRAVTQLFGDGQTHTVNDDQVWKKEREYKRQKMSKNIDPVYGSMDSVPELSAY
ncbi:hypothetical protein [Endozoicomonas lisbonensis]|uniref:Cytochrome c556 n=1 Tax=Endozoicomonas lisbonensis TaxID=3120522 RepID=A0ABV2SP50_9GAMM